MTGQHDRQDERLTGQLPIQSGHCPLTGRYFEPCLHEQFILCRTNLLAIFIARVHDLFPISKEFEAYFHKTKTEYFLFFEEKAISIVLALET